MSLSRSRLAPSPTGALHLGNASTFIVNQLIARHLDWELVFRMEDLCGPRKKPNVIKETVEVMQWLGLEWNGSVKIQSESMLTIKSYFKKLVQQHAVYHCDLSRKEIQTSLTAPDSGEHPSDNIRPTDVSEHNSGVVIPEHNWRFITKSKQVNFHDEIHGECVCDPTPDFAIWTIQDAPSYQIAVIIDDYVDGVTDVVRGSDLINSTSWQIQILEALNLPIPRWWHLPLVCGSDGRKLGKRHGDTTIAYFNNKGVPVEAIYGLIGYWYGFVSERTSLSMNELQFSFNFDSIPRDEIVCTKEDITWLHDCSQY